VHPETGGRSLFVNPLFTDKLDGLRHRESDAVLNLLFASSVAAELVVRWRWHTGDVAMWDNRCTMHYALLDFGTDRRRMLRVALDGDKPVGVTDS
jgi:alpha-ketoglutarate-dependent taurine dioxygenase